MSKLPVQKATTAMDRKLPIFEEFEELAERIRIQAFNLFQGRGFTLGKDLDDWLTAEREICWPAAQLDESDAGFELLVELAGFKPKDVAVTVTPRELMLKATRKVTRRESDDADQGRTQWSELRGNEVYRRIELPIDIDVNKVTAVLTEGMLTVNAPKMRAKKPASKKVKVTESKPKAKPKKKAAARSPAKTKKKAKTATRKKSASNRATKTSQA